MDRNRWGRLVDRFISDLRAFDFLGRHLDVRENVKFVGRQFPKWVHTRFPATGWRRLRSSASLWSLPSSSVYN